jgi:hypothetical protein
VLGELSVPLGSRGTPPNGAQYRQASSALPFVPLSDACFRRLGALTLTLLGLF